jgi:hypothetical protein
MYHLKMEKQMSNSKSVRTPTLLELSDNSKRSLLLPQAQVNNQVNSRSIPVRSTTTPGNKHLRHKLLLSSDATMINLAPTEYVQETSSGTRRFSGDTTPSSQRSCRRCTDRRKRSWIQQIRSKFLLQE